MHFWQDIGSLCKLGFFGWCWYASGSFWVGIFCWFLLEFCILGAIVMSRMGGSILGIALIFIGVDALFDDDCDDI